jgi:hypothetical protein
MSTISKMPIPEPNTPNTTETPASNQSIIEPIIVTDGMYL